MQTAWRERNPSARIKAAKDAIGLNAECATAYILLAEEEVHIQFIERVLVCISNPLFFTDLDPTLEPKVDPYIGNFPLFPSKQLLN